MPRIESAETPRFQQVGVNCYGTRLVAINVDLHTDTNNFAPNEYREVVNPSGLVVHKGLKAMIVVIDSVLQ